jgi:hypothetical protein
MGQKRDTAVSLGSWRRGARLVTSRSVKKRSPAAFLRAGNWQVQLLGTVLARGFLQVVPWRQADGLGATWPTTVRNSARGVAFQNWGPPGRVFRAARTTAQSL